MIHFEGNFRMRVGGIFFSLLVATLALGLFGGCAGRNLYKNVRLGPPPLQTGYVRHTTDGLGEAGQDPVEFGSPLATADSVYVASALGLQAFERATYVSKWKLPIVNGVGSELLLDNHVLYFGAQDAGFYAVDADLGKVLWRYDAKAPIFARASVSAGKVYFQAADDVVYCVDQSNGKWIWHYKRGGSYITTVHGNSAPVVDGNLVYVGFSDGYVVALGAKDGNLAWEQKIHMGAKFTDVDAMALIDDNRLYIPSYDGALYALDKNNGKVFWHIDVGGSKRVTMDDQKLFLASSNGSVYSIEKETGRILWRFELDEGTPTNLVQRENYLAFGSSRQWFYVIRKGDGSLAYRHSVGTRSGFVSTPMQSGEDIFVLSSVGNLYVFQWLPNPKRTLH